MLRDVRDSNSASVVSLLKYSVCCGTLFCKHENSERFYNFLRFIIEHRSPENIANLYLFWSPVIVQFVRYCVRWVNCIHSEFIRKQLAESDIGSNEISTKFLRTLNKHKSQLTKSPSIISAVSGWPVNIRNAATTTIKCFFHQVSWEFTPNNSHARILCFFLSSYKWFFCRKIRKRMTSVLGILRRLKKIWNNCMYVHTSMHRHSS